MPDKPAQHGPRTWFEEPPRPEHGARTDGDATDSEIATQLPGSGVEHGGNGGVAAPSRPTATAEPAGPSAPEPGPEPEAVGPPDSGSSSAPPRESAAQEPAPQEPAPQEPDAEVPAVAQTHASPDVGSATPAAAEPETPVAAESEAPAAEPQAPVAAQPAAEPASGEPEASAATEPIAAQPVAAAPEPSAAQPETQCPAAAQPGAPAGTADSEVPAGTDAEAPGGADTEAFSVAQAPAPAEQSASGDRSAPNATSPGPPHAMDDAATAVIPVVTGLSEGYPEPGTRAHPQQPPPGFDAAATMEIPRVRGVTANVPAGWSSAAQPPPQFPVRDNGPGTGPVGPPPRGRSSWTDRFPPMGRGGTVAVAVLGLLLLVYLVDIAASRGEVPRGVTVAEVPIGGLDRVAAEQRLREQLEPRLTGTLTLLAGDAEVPLDPGAAGLSLDWPATLDEAGEQPLNPWTRFVSVFTGREVGVVTTGDRDTVTAALEELRSTIDRESIEGTIRFEGAAPIPVDPIPGQRLDVPAAVDVLLAEWIRGESVQLPVEPLPVSTTPEGIRVALTEFVEPAVSGPVTISGDGVDAVLDPRITADALRFAPDDAGGLDVTIDDAVIVEALSPKLAETEQEARDASIVIEGGRPVVLPSAEGRTIDWEKSLLPLPDVLLASGGQRSLPAVYNTETPSLSTEQARQLGITTEISTFTTGGFATDSGQNIRRAAEQVNGALVRPGETFSLNGHTGPRNAASGYADAGIIQDGRPARGIGGGVSQFATTLFNASYFAGMVDVEHREHSYYISRYPAGREATVYEGAIDVKFRNDSPTGILIQTEWTPSSVTVTFWGTKHVEVESITGDRTNFTEPQTRRINDENCVSTSGSRGFTVTDTRVVRDASSGAEIERNTRTVVYNPQPRIICE